MAAPIGTQDMLGFYLKIIGARCVCLFATINSTNKTVWRVHAERRESTQLLKYTQIPIQMDLRIFVASLVCHANSLLEVVDKRYVVVRDEDPVFAPATAGTRYEFLLKMSSCLWMKRTVLRMRPQPPSQQGSGCLTGRMLRQVAALPVDIIHVLILVIAHWGRALTKP